MTNPLADKLNTEISNILKVWNDPINGKDTLPDNIIAFNFGLQKVYEGYETYLDGYNWFDADDGIWLLDVAWNPKNNFIALSSFFHSMDTIELLNVYKDVISEKILSGEFRLPGTIKSVSVSLVNGRPIKII